MHDALDGKFGIKWGGGGNSNYQYFVEVLGSHVVCAMLNWNRRKYQSLKLAISVSSKHKHRVKK